MATELSSDVASREMSPTLPLTLDGAAVENCVGLARLLFLFYCHSVAVETSAVLLVVLLLRRLTDTERLVVNVCSRPCEC